MRAVKGTTEAIKTVLELAGTLPGERATLTAQVTASSVDELVPEVLFVALARLSSWLEVLNAPLEQAIGRDIPFMSLAVQAIAHFQQQRSAPKTLIEGTFLLAQSAYLQSLQAFAAPLRERFSRGIGASAGIAEQIRNLTAPANNEAALEVWFCFHNSTLAPPFNEILQARLQESGWAKAAARRLTERVSRGAFRYLRETAHEVWGNVQRLQGFLEQSHLDELRFHTSLERYLQQEIARKPAEKVFDEAFSYEEIYVPLQVKSLDRNAGPHDPGDIEGWAAELLARDDVKVLSIQSGPGGGKSVFCRLFADKVRRELHPIWTPISIRLRDLEILGSTFEETLRLNLRGAFLRENCLAECNTRFLFLLDGFDDLLLNRLTAEEFKRLLAQLARFHREYSGGEGRSDKDHRLILTGQPSALRSIERAIASDLERVEIVLMDGDRQARWLQRWNEAHGRELATGFREFLAACPQAVRAIARKPLLLYLLAAMHRDGRLTVKTLAQLDAEQAEVTPPAARELAAKVLVYRQAIDWALAQQNLDPANSSARERPMVGLGAADLREVLREIGLCAVQAGRESARLGVVASRLEPAIAAALQEEAAESPATSCLTGAIMASYPRAEAERVVEFTHASFGRFLCAERLVAVMVAWAQKSGQRRQTHTLPDADVWWQVYDLLGYGHLSPEILACVLALLQEKEREQAGLLAALGERLQEFYWRWSGGNFIAKRHETLPQRKATLLQAQGSDKGQREVDIYAGFNALKLLFCLPQRHVPFHPCSEPKTEVLDRTRLLRLLGYGACMEVPTLAAELGPYLAGASLSEVNLSGADLRTVNLGRANLSRANLSRADLQAVNMSEANLSGANLSGANLSGANLSGASLIRADLRGARLHAADLRGANPIGATFGGADLSSAALGGANFREADLSGVDLFKANLGGASLSEADLREAKLREAKLRGVDLSKANLSGANLSRANLSRTNLSAANLREVKLREANLREVDLFKADLFKATLSRVNLIGAKLIGANLREADLFKANLGRANLIGADLMGANLIGVDLRGANLRGANLRGAKYSAKETRFPEGFDIRAARIVRMED